MKGKQLTLEEVLNLEDGSKVWVDDNRWGFDSSLCEYIERNSHLLVLKNYTHYLLNSIELYCDSLTFYEWNEETNDNEWLLSKLSTLPKVELDSCRVKASIVKDMATEICNLRGINLTDDNIDKIMKEFVIGENR